MIKRILSALIGISIFAQGAAIPIVQSGGGTQAKTVSGAITIDTSGVTSTPTGEGYQARGVSVSGLSSLAPSFAGQLAGTTDQYLAIASGTSAGNWRTMFLHNGTEIRPLAPIYSTSGSLTLTQGYVRAASLDGEHVFSIQTGGSGINVAIIDRPDDGYYSALQINTAGTEKAAVGVGTHTEGSGYADKFFIEAGHISGAANNHDTREIFAAQYASVDGDALYYYKRIILGASTGDFSLYQLVPGQGRNGSGDPTSPIALFVSGNGGQVGVGTSSPSSIASAGGKTVHLYSTANFPSYMIETAGGRKWAMGIGDGTDSYAWLLRNETANSNPIVVAGDAANETVKLTSTGVTVGGTLAASGVVADGSGITNLDASKILSGTIGAAYLPMVASRVSSDQTSTSTSLANVTGLTANVSANKKYYFRAELQTQNSAAGEALGLAINGPAACTNISASAVIYTSAVGAMNVGTITAFESAVIGTTGSATVFPSIVSGYFETGVNAGTFAIRYKTETGSANSSTVKAGSFLIVQELP